MKNCTSKPRRSQRGWGLVEGVVALMLTGVMATGVWKTMELVGKNTEGEVSRDVLQRAEDALYGMALRDAHFPLPEEARTQPGNPDLLVGWLPAGVLGTAPPRSIRYVVDSGLVATTVLYHPDPAGLLNDDELNNSGAARSLDFCLQVIQREATGLARLDNMSIAMGVQQAGLSEKSSGPSTGFQFGSSGATAATETGQINSRALGHLELVHRMGCMQAFARLANAVKSAALLESLHTLSQIETDWKALLVQGAKTSLRSHKWRKSVAIVRLVDQLTKALGTLITVSTTPAGAAVSVATLAIHGVVTALWIELIKFSQEGIDGGEKGLPKKIEAHRQAQLVTDEFAKQRDSYINTAKSVRLSGAQP